MPQAMSRAAPLIAPFAGLRPAAGRAAEVLAPPYDVLNSEEARAWAAGRPWCFLHVAKPEIDLSPDADPYGAATYAKGAENLSRMVREGVLRRDEQDCYYVYRVSMGARHQTGLVAGVSVAAYERNDVRRHELTRPKKEDDRVRHMDAVGAQTSPVFLAYKGRRGVDDMLRGLSESAPDTDVTMADGVRHELWVIDGRDVLAALTAEFDDMGVVYIADGHHRSAAAARVAAMRRERGGGNEDNGAAHEYFLAVIFPDHQVRILDYNRVVRDLNGLSADELLRKVGGVCDCRAVSGGFKPGGPGMFGMYLDGRWYALTVARPSPAADPARRLDVSLLAEHVIEPFLGVSDPRTDERIDFVGGLRGLGELEKRVDSGAAAVAFSLYPTAMADLVAVADAGRVMPPKSTWFEPKLADGIVSRVLD